ncbi:Formate-dependent phosphoribosylglycinamide formyltransferase [subsurface metagenome]
MVEPRDLQKLDKIFQKTLPDAVIADGCDYSMFAVAYLTNKYNLLGPKMDSLMITNNKYLERKFAEKGNIPQPKFKLCMTFNEVNKAAKQLGLPVMLKPLDNRGSIGVCRVERIQDLKNAFFETLANSHSRQMLVEEFIPGNVVTVEGLYAGKFYNLSFSTKKMHPKYPDNAMHLQYPGNLPDFIVKKLYFLNNNLIKEIGINFGLTHSEFIINNDKVYFLEIANRGGGVHISNKIIPYVTGVDTCDVFIRSAFGEHISLNNFSQYKRKRYSLLHFFDFNSGKVIEIKNYEKIKKIKGILTVRINFKVGNYLGNAKTALNRPGFVIVTGNTLDKCNSILKEACNTIMVRVERKEGGINFECK